MATRTAQKRASQAAAQKEPVKDNEEIVENDDDSSGVEEEQNGTSGLSAEDIANAFADGDEDESDEDDEDEDAESGELTLASIKAMVTGAIGALDVDKKIEKVMDRRINVVLDELRKGSGGKPKGKAKDDDDEDDTVTAPKAGNASYGRLAFKAALSEQEFSSKEEREFARTVGSRVITSAAVGGFDGKDADTFAEDLATELATSVAGLRTHYQEKVSALLKSRGLMKVDTTGQGPQAKDKQSVGDRASFKAGQARAQQRHGSAAK